MDKDARNIFGYISHVPMFLFVMGKYLGIWLLNHRIDVFSTLFKAAALYSKVAAPFYTPPGVDKSSSFYTSFPNFGVVSLSNFRHPKRHAVLSLCGFWLSFPHDHSNFIILIGHSCILFCEILSPRLSFNLNFIVVFLI